MTKEQGWMNACIQIWTIGYLQCSNLFLIHFAIQRIDLSIDTLIPCCFSFFTIEGRSVKGATTEIKTYGLVNFLVCRMKLQ